MKEERASQYKPGQQIGDFLLESPLGVGGAGEVWLAENIFTGMKAAVKFCHDPLMQETLRNEARTIGDLLSASGEKSFPTSIVKLLETHLSDDPPSLVMEYCAGGDVRELLEASSELPTPLVNHLIQSVLKALGWAHGRGIIHRDIKPENILLKERYDPAAPTAAFPLVKVGDFGLGLPSETRTLSIHRSLGLSGALSVVEGTSSGTLEYMSPEQMEGDVLTPASDIYAVGIVLFELLTGRRPRGRILPSSLRPGLKPGWDRVFEKCYSYNPADRYIAADEMLRDLEGLDNLGGAAAAWTKPPIHHGVPVDSSFPGATDPSSPSVAHAPHIQQQINKSLEVLRTRLANSDLLRVKPTGEYQEVEQFQVLDLEEFPMGEVSINNGYAWPGEESPKVASWAGRFKLLKKLLLLFFILSVIPLTRFILGPFSGISFMAFLGLYIAIVLVEYMLGDILMGVDGDAKSRMLFHAISDSRAVLGRIQPSSRNSKFLELRGPDKEIIGFLDNREKDQRKILAPDGEPLYTLKRGRGRAKIGDGRKLKRYTQIRRWDNGELAGVYGRDVSGGMKSIWLPPNTHTEVKDREQVILTCLALAVRENADW